MTNEELILNMLAELSIKNISEVRNPGTFNQHIDVARQGGDIARNARIESEEKTGKRVVTPLNAKGIFQLKEKDQNKTENPEE